MTAFGNQNGEFDDIPGQIPYSATVENIDNDVAVDTPQADLEEAPSIDVPANKSNESKRVFGIFRRQTRKQKRESDSRWSIAYLVAMIVFQLFVTSIGLSDIGDLIRQNLQDTTVVWWGYYTSVVELAALAEYVASPFGLLVFLWVRTNRCKQGLKVVLWLWTLVLALLGVVGMVASPYITNKDDSMFFMVVLLSLLVPICDFRGRYANTSIEKVILKG